MPAKNTTREFEKDGIYHVYNLGVAKKNIFLNSDDYNIFLYYLNTYLLPLDKALARYPDLPLRLQIRNLNKEVEILAYCLMPNHFHLLLKTKTRDGITKLLRQLTSAYTGYFNRKYDNEGPIMQGKYKSVRVTKDEQLIHVARYIHLNPTTAFLVDKPSDYKWSSHNEYLKEEQNLCSKNLVMGFFSSIEAYEKFVLDQKAYSQELARIKHLSLES